MDGHPRPVGASSWFTQSDKPLPLCCVCDDRCIADWIGAPPGVGLVNGPLFQEKLHHPYDTSVCHEQNTIAGKFPLAVFEEQLNPTSNVGQAFPTGRPSVERSHRPPVILQPGKCGLRFRRRHVERETGVAFAEKDALAHHRAGRLPHGAERQRGRLPRAPITRVVHDVERAELSSQPRTEFARLLATDGGQAGLMVSFALEAAPSVGIRKEHLTGLRNVPGAFGVTDDHEKGWQFCHGWKVD
jgi:hypothetical protein